MQNQIWARTPLFIGVVGKVVVLSAIIKGCLIQLFYKKQYIL